MIRVIYLRLQRFMRFSVCIAFIAAASMFAGPSSYNFSLRCPFVSDQCAGSMGGFDGLQAGEIVDASAANAAYANFQGKPHAEVKAELQKMHPGLHLRVSRALFGTDRGAGFDIQCIPEGSMVTMDYRTDRIRVYFNDGTVCIAALSPIRSLSLLLPSRISSQSRLILFAAGLVVGIPHAG